MPTLLGRTTAGASADFNAPASTACWKFTAIASGTLTVIKAQTQVANAGATNIQLGIYTDNGAGTHPSSKMEAGVVDSNATAQGTGVFQRTLGTPQTIVSGTIYWLAWSGSTGNWDFAGTAAGAYVELLTPAIMPAAWGSDAAGSIDAILWGESAAGKALIADPRRTHRNTALRMRRREWRHEDSGLLVPAYS